MPNRYICNSSHESHSATMPVLTWSEGPTLGEDNTPGGRLLATGHPIGGLSMGLKDDAKNQPHVRCQIDNRVDDSADVRPIPCVQTVKEGPEMTEQVQKSHQWAERLQQREAAAQRRDSEAVFFFDGDFRTWGQVHVRAQLNMAFAAQEARN